MMTDFPQSTDNVSKNVAVVQGKWGLMCLIWPCPLTYHVLKNETCPKEKSSR